MEQELGPPRRAAPRTALSTSGRPDWAALRSARGSAAFESCPLRSWAGVSLGLSFPTWGESALPGLCDRPKRGARAPILRVTRRAHSAYLRPSDLSCSFLLAADPGGALARLFPGLPEGGAGAV